VPSYVDSQIGTQKEQLSYTIAAGSTKVSIGVAAPTLSAGWLWQMRSATVARVRDRNPLGIADDLVRAPFLAITSVWPIRELSRGGAEESTVEGQTLRRQVAISQVTRITLTTAQKSPILADNSFVMIFSF
jgi:hypothetical protein